MPDPQHDLFFAPPTTGFSQHSVEPATGRVIDWLVPAHHHPPTGTVVAPLLFHERIPAPELPVGEITPDAVPQASKPQPVPLARAIMPIVMVVALLAMVGLMFLSSGTLNPMMLVFPLMMGMGLFMMFSPPPGENTDEIRRKYLRHIQTVRTQARDNAKAQREHEYHQHPAPHQLWSMVNTPRLWERNADDKDAFAVRVGRGATALCTPIEVADPGATEDLDPVCAISLRQAVAAVSTLDDMPIVVDLTAFKEIVLTGTAAAAMARAIIAQLVFHHGPEAVGIATRGASFGWCKWLPHTAPQAVKTAKVSVLLIDDSVSTTEVEQILAEQNWSVLIAANNPTNLLYELAEDEGLILVAEAKLAAQTETGEETIGVPDQLDEAAALVLARKLTCFSRPETAESEGTVGLLGLLGVPDFTPEILARLWQPRGKKSLSVPIGQDESGHRLVIDIKESAHGGAGPHGLCVGATGSGKSELLRTLVVALAATHPPNTLNFVLVDFKGGATFLGLDGLPHTSAVITNLAEEAILVERMHDAISGELNRRQEWLRKMGNFANVADYELARTEHPEWPPLPALLIVVDEFSELLGQHPEFADLFVAVGRLGRSLQVHLLLASQRLEEGRLRGLDSHLSYRIGLKTFSLQESRQVLGVPDAYHLPSKPGAGFYKSDADQLLSFQTAYVSGELLRPKSHVSIGDAMSISYWDGWDETTTEPVELVKDARGTLVTALVEAASELGQQLGQQAHRIWLPPLPEAIALHEVVPQHHKDQQLSVAIGIIDRPYLQRQDLLTIDFLGQHGHLCVSGGPQTGKTTALRSMALALALTETTDAIRLYVLDLAGKSLSSLALLPHVAGVAHRGEEEKIGRIIDEVTSFIDEPESRHTFLIIDGWHIIHSEYEHLQDKLARIAADGLAARVHLIIATPRWTAVRPAIKDLIPGRLELKLTEALDSVINRKAQEKLPSCPGRGLSSSGEAMLIADSSQQDIAHVATISAQQPPVPPLAMLPAAIALTELPVMEGKPLSAVPVGVGGPKLGLVTWDFNTDQHIICFGGRGSGKSTFITTLIDGLCSVGSDTVRLVVLDHRRTHLGEIDPQMLAGYSASRAETEKLINDCVITLKRRLPGAEITPEQLKARSWWSGPEIMLIIDDLDLIEESLLHPLLDLLPHAKDIGLHLVVARKVGGAVRALYHPFLNELKDQSPQVILLDATKDDGPLFGVRTRPQPVGRGTVITRGTDCGLIQIAHVEGTKP